MRNRRGEHLVFALFLVEMTLKRAWIQLDYSCKQKRDNRPTFLHNVLT